VTGLPKNFSEDPIAQFSRWFKEAETCQALEQANAMCLSTMDLDGFPDGRMVLLKGFDARGFVFYTNFHSVKGRSLQALPRAALTFFWDPLHRQVRIQGDVAPVKDAEADAYWASRPRISQISAWASRQSEPMDRLGVLIKRLQEYRKKFGTGVVPRPPHWSGFRVAPRKIEFWRARRGRLHERFLYQKKESRWIASRLFP
jgi:pyridoxamine 5'-phosphate oxidase